MSVTQNLGEGHRVVQGFRVRANGSTWCAPRLSLLYDKYICAVSLLPGPRDARSFLSAGRRQHVVRGARPLDPPPYPPPPTPVLGKYASHYVHFLMLDITPGPGCLCSSSRVGRWFARAALVASESSAPAAPSDYPVGAEVVLAGSTTDGCLSPGDVGVIVVSDGSGVPYEVCPLAAQRNTALCT